MSPPVPESDLLRMWCVAIYFSNTSRKKGTLFLTERDGFLDSVELDCLKPAYGPSSTILEGPPEHLGKDIGIRHNCMSLTNKLPLKT